MLRIADTIGILDGNAPPPRGLAEVQHYFDRDDVDVDAVHRGAGIPPHSYYYYYYISDKIKLI